MTYIPWWLLIVCLPVAAVAVYLALSGTEISRRALYASTIVLAPVLLLGTALAAIVVSTALSAVFEPSAPSPAQPVPAEVATPETTVQPPQPTTPEPTTPEPTSPAASPSASPSASPAASSASASASASPAPGN